MKFGCWRNGVSVTIAAALVLESLVAKAEPAARVEGPPDEPRAVEGGEAGPPAEDAEPDPPAEHEAEPPTEAEPQPPAEDAQAPDADPPSADLEPPVEAEPPVKPEADLAAARDVDAPDLDAPDLDAPDLDAPAEDDDPQTSAPPILQRPHEPAPPLAQPLADLPPPRPSRTEVILAPHPTPDVRWCEMDGRDICTPMKVSGGLALGLGIASVATGLGFVFVDNKPSANDPRFERMLRPTGIALIGAGMLVTTLGAFLLGEAIQRKRAPNNRFARTSP
jgi:hypothetical protein